MKGKTKSQKSARKLYLKAERLWKEYAFLRDGRECKVRRYFPYIATDHIDILHVDHCISRANKHLFFETANATIICGKCNQLKGYKVKSIDEAVRKIVIDREGLEKYEEMVRLDQTKGPNIHWGKIYWLEEVVKDLEEKVSKLKSPVLGAMAG